MFLFSPVVPQESFTGLRSFLLPGRLLCHKGCPGTMLDWILKSHIAHAKLMMSILHVHLEPPLPLHSYEHSN